MVVGNIHLGIACKMVLDDQGILHDGFLFHAHCHFHGHVVDVYQIQQLSTEDGLHGGYLGLGFEHMAFLTVADTHHHPLGHAWPPESFSE